MSKLFVICLIWFCTLLPTCPIELLGRFSFEIASMYLLSHCQRYLITRHPLILVGLSCSVAPNSCFQSPPEFRNNDFVPACCQTWCCYRREKKKKLKKTIPDVGRDSNTHKTDPGRPGLAGDLGMSCAGSAARNAMWGKPAPGLSVNSKQMRRGWVQP